MSHAAAIQSFSRGAVSPETVQGASLEFFKSLGPISENDLLDAVGALRTEILANGSGFLKDSTGFAPQVTSDVIHRIVAGYNAAQPELAQSAAAKVSLAKPARTLGLAVATAEGGSAAADISSPPSRGVRPRLR